MNSHLIWTLCQHFLGQATDHAFIQNPLLNKLLDVPTTLSSANKDHGFNDNGLKKKFLNVQTKERMMKTVFSSFIFLFLQVLIKEESLSLFMTVCMVNSFTTINQTILLVVLVGQANGQFNRVNTLQGLKKKKRSRRIRVTPLVCIRVIFKYFKQGLSLNSGSH